MLEQLQNAIKWFRRPVVVNRMEQRNQLFTSIQEDLAYREDYKKYAVDILDGPYQHVIKITNTDNFRMIRIEIPTEEHKNQQIAIHYLERTHDVIENLDSFYTGDTVYMDTVKDVEQALDKGTVFIKWFSSDVDRSNDRIEANAMILPSATSTPKSFNMVYCDIIRVVDVIEREKNIHHLKIRFANTDGHRDISIPSESAYNFKNGNLYVVTNTNKSMAVPFNKARHYLLFNKTTWGLIKKSLR